MTQTIQIEGMDELIEAVGSGGGGGGAVVPTPTLDDESKVLKAVPQTQTTVAPEWSTIREVPIGGRNGQVLTKDSDGYGWATPEGGLPSISSSDSGKVLRSWYDSEEGYGYSRWDTIASVPGSNASDSGKVLTCTGRNAYGWAPASGGGGNIDVLKIDVNKSDFSPDEGSSGYYVAGIMASIPNAVTKINNMIGITIVDNVDSGYPSFATAASDSECSIYYDDMVYIKINSTIYGKLGTRQANHFYMTYYKGN